MLSLSALMRAIILEDMSQIEILTFSLGELSTNCYLVTDPITTDTFIIDPADDAPFLSEEITRRHLHPTALILTHAHYDHALALLELHLAFRIPIMLHPDDLFLYQRLHRYTPQPPIPHQNLTDHARIALGQTSLEVIHTPGHTPGSICLNHQPSHQLFTGDTLFLEAVGRTDLPYSSESNLQKSLARLAKLPAETICYSGHTDPTTIGAELSSLASR